MTRPTARVLALLELLQSGGVRTRRELAERLEVDERTVRRYVAHLIDLEIPVESVRGRYGGYRLARGFRVPPLMFTEDEALAVVLGLIAQPNGGAGEAASAKVRRVLPSGLKDRLDAVLDSLAFTNKATNRVPVGAEKATAPKTGSGPGWEAGPRAGSEVGSGAGTGPAGRAEPGGVPVVPEGAVLLAIGDAIRCHQPISFRYTDRQGRESDRELHPYGLVIHNERWYVGGMDPAVDEYRTLRVDRVAGVRKLRGFFAAPAERDQADRVLAGFARAAYEHEVILRVRATAEQIRARLPASLAVIGAGDGGWLRVEMRVRQLDWLPSLIASLDSPFVIEQPAALRDLVAAFADRTKASARCEAHQESSQP